MDDVFRFLEVRVVSHKVLGEDARADESSANTSLNARATLNNVWSEDDITHIRQLVRHLLHNVVVTRSSLSTTAV